MRKDYVPVDALGEAAGEATFVERFWTEQWKDRARPADVSFVAGREEYRLMQPFVDRLPSGSRILDGGCGMGEWTVFLSRRGFDVIGMDISEQTVDRLREWFPEQRFEHGDLRQTRFEDGAFDTYFSWGTFEHFEAGLGGCLAEARRIVRPGGWLFITVPFHNWRLILGDARPLPRWDRNFAPESGYPSAQRFYQWRLTRPELRRELELHGFRVHGVTPIAKVTGAGRLLRSDLRLFSKGTRPYNAACRALALCAPASFLGHMIFAAAERR